MSIDSHISDSSVAGHHEEKQAAICETHGHASDSTTGSEDHNHHEQKNKHAEGERQ
jgi:hypothetical protein